MDLDVRSARDFGGPNVVKNYEQEYGDAPLADPAKPFFTFDLCAPACTLKYADNQQFCRDFARKHGLKVYDVDCGIGSHILIEEGLARPNGTAVVDGQPSEHPWGRGQLRPGDGRRRHRLRLQDGEDLVRSSGKRQGPPQGNARRPGVGQGSDPLPLPRAGNQSIALRSAEFYGARGRETFAWPAGSRSAA